MYFDQPGSGQPAPALQPGVRLMVGINGMAALALGLLPGPLLSLCGRLLN
jgi:NADH-quinone oxidoreductase subunit N